MSRARALDGSGETQVPELVEVCEGQPGWEAVSGTAHMNSGYSTPLEHHRENGPQLSVTASNEESQGTRG